ILASPNSSAARPSRLAQVGRVVHLPSQSSAANPSRLNERAGPDPAGGGGGGAAGPAGPVRPPRPRPSRREPAELAVDRGAGFSIVGNDKHVCELPFLARTPPAPVRALPP